jgi:hypothetical protein
MDWTIFEGGYPLLDRQVDVVGHEAEGVEAAALPCHGVREPVDEVAPVVVVDEDRLGVVPPEHRVVKGSGERNPQKGVELAEQGIAAVAPAPTFPLWDTTHWKEP